ncbi:MAG: hypothetical protein JSR55_16200 [Proteobacteria bacterium]|nr:hypothetical protein [Pseudomonadota bacterium]
MSAIASKLLAVTLVAQASAQLPSTPAAQPHAIRNAQDAVDTAYNDWKTQYPKSGIGGLDEWRKEFSAKFDGNTWEVRQIMSSPSDTRGTYIYLDPKDGHILQAQIVD